MPTNPEPSQHLPQKDRAALLVIDAQERLALAMPPGVGAGVLRNTRILIETAREFDLPIRITEQYPKGLGRTAPDLTAALPQDVVPFEKVAFSCCAAAGFLPLLDELGDRDWIVCGIETHVCVLQSVLDLLAGGRRIFVAADATCSRTKLNWSLGLNLMREAGAVVGSTEIFAFALTGAAGTEQFRRISRLVK